MYFLQLLEDHLLAVTSFGLGVLAHVNLFRVGEWDVAVKNLCAIYLVLYASLIFLLSSLNFDGPSLYSLTASILPASIITLVHLSGVFISMSIYRLFLHPLRKFPGPFWAALSSWYMTTKAVQRFPKFKHVHKLHQQYGDFVRIGA